MVWSGLMARVGQRTAVAGGELAGSVSVGVLERVFSRAFVDGVIAECGRREQRVRALPARVVAYFCLGLALWSDGSYEDVLGMVSSGLLWADGDEGPAQMASKVALFKACLLYTSPSPRDRTRSRMPSSA